jgi:polyhydroxybutyrate depolymerase
MRPSRTHSIAIAAAAIVLLGGTQASSATGLSPDSLLTGRAETTSGAIGGRERHYILYVPRNLQFPAPLVFVLHGGGQDGPNLRLATGYEFDMLADRNGFLTVYPDGIEHGWNTCRKATNNAATRQHIDDVAFIDAIIAHEVTTHNADRTRVFAVGHSNGGQLAFRLGLERPNAFAGVAAISSNLPATNNMMCQPSNIPIPVMIINGTADPVNPYRGGRTGRGTVTQGNVISAEATAQYFAKINGVDGMAEVVRLPHRNESDPTWVEQFSWSAAGKPSVILYAVHGGGHVVPQPYYRYPNIVGRQTQDLDAPAVVWDFFSKLPCR